MQSNDSEHPEARRAAERPVSESDVVLPNASPRPHQAEDSAVEVLDRLATKLVGAAASREGAPGRSARSSRRVHDRPARGFD